MTAALFWFWLGGVAAASSISLATSPRAALSWRAWAVWTVWPVFHVYVAATSRRRLLDAAQRVIDEAREERGE